MAIANVIPGFEGLTSGASNLIKSLMSGSLAPGTRKAIYDAGAERGVAAGMPGSSGIASSLFANADLRDIGRTSEQQQQQGFQDLLAMITGFSGTVTPTAGQDIQDRQFRTQFGAQQQQQGFENDLASRQMKLREQEYLQRYGPRRRAFGTMRKGKFSTRLSAPGDFGATGGNEGFEFEYEPNTGRIVS